MKRVRLIVHGIVQGVGFRYFTAMEARKTGIHGFVRNRVDGTVEIEAEGEPAMLNRFVKDVETGPRYATVSRVERTDIAPTGETGFAITG